MADAAGFSVDTPRRCFGWVPGPAGHLCGERALWMRPSRLGLAAEFFCDAHRREDCVPIAADAPFRRVTLMIEVLISGTSLLPTVAHKEAAERVLAALDRLGAVPNLVNITSAIGRLAPPPPAGKGAAGRGGLG